MHREVTTHVEQLVDSVCARRRERGACDPCGGRAHSKMTVIKVGGVGRLTNRGPFSQGWPRHTHRHSNIRHNVLGVAGIVNSLAYRVRYWSVIKM